MRQVILLKPIQKWWRNVLELRVFNDNHAFKVRVDSARLDVGPDGDIGVVARSGVGVDAMESTVEEVVEGLMDGVGLAEDYSVALVGRVTNSCNRVHLWEKRDELDQLQWGVTMVTMYKHMPMIASWISVQTHTLCS